MSVFCKKCGIHVKTSEIPLMGFGGKPTGVRFDDGWYCFNCAVERRNKGATPEPSRPF